MKILFAALLFLVSSAPGCARAGEAPPVDKPAATEKTVTFKNTEGLETGTAMITGTPNGVLFRLDLQNLPPGEHAFHIHEHGVCDPAAKFDSAGAHYNPESDQHGYHAEEGPHEGDMPNLTILPDGTLNAEVFNEEAELDELVADDGAALMIHEKTDDYRTQPSGNAGGRIACAVVK
ncbi:MAG: superoxide dismutase family protein [Alphaproteobacteria bacterium]